MALSKLKKIAPLSAALVVGFINAITGLVFGILVAISTGTLLQYAGMQSMMQDVMTVAGTNVTTRLSLIVLYPVVGFVTGFLGTLITVWLYNLIAKKLPIRVEIK